MEKLNKLKEVSSLLNILYIEDDIFLQQKTVPILKEIFGKVDVANDGDEGLIEYQSYFYENYKYYDLVVTDIAMPNKNGLDMSVEILKINPDQKIVVTSAYNDSEYLIEFINIGISRYIKKPFNSTSLIETLYNVCKAFEVKNSDNKIKIVENFSWDNKAKLLFQNSSEIKLSQNETIVLNLLINNQASTFSNEDIFATIQNYNYEKEFSINSLKSLIKRLRKKLPIDFIQNIYSQGYRINPELIS